MNQKSIEAIAKGPGRQWYYNTGEAAELLGCGRARAAAFLREHSVPHHRITGRAKSYFLDDIIAAVEKSRWK